MLDEVLEAKSVASKIIVIITNLEAVMVTQLMIFSSIVADLLSNFPERLSLTELCLVRKSYSVESNCFSMVNANLATNSTVDHLFEG